MKIKIGQCRREIAEKIALFCAPGYDCSGKYYAIDSDGDFTIDKVVFANRNRYFNPWSDNSIAISVIEFLPDYVDPTISDDEDYETAIDFIAGELYEEIDMETEA